MTSNFSIKSIIPLQIKETLRPIALRNTLTRKLITLRPSDYEKSIDIAKHEVEEATNNDLDQRLFEPQIPEEIFHQQEESQILDCDLLISFAGNLFNAQLESWVGAALSIDQPGTIVNQLASGEPVLANGPVHDFRTTKRLLKAIRKQETQAAKSDEISPEPGFMNSTEPLVVGFLFDETGYFDSEDFGDEQARLANYIKYLPAANDCFKFKWIRFKHGKSNGIKKDAKGYQIRLDSAAALSPRFANPYFSTRRAYRKLSKSQKTRCLVLDWQAIISDPLLVDIFNETVAKHPYVEFVLADPLWQIPTNAKTTNPFIEAANVKFCNPLPANIIGVAGANFDGYLVMKPELIGQFPLLQTLVTAFARQGLKGYFAASQKEVAALSKTLAGNENDLMWTSDEMPGILEANIDASENRLGAAFGLIANAPTSIWEMLFASGSVASGPVSWSKGLCVITLHRLQHLDNIEQSLKRVFDIGLNCKLVCHGLSEDEKKAVKKRFAKDWPKLGYHFEDHFGLGKAISDAVGSSDSQFWSKIDDDDDYRTPYWYEIYTALRLSQCGYVGKRASLYHFVESGRLYARATATRFGKMSGAPGHIPGATLSGLTETVRRIPFPRFAKFHMDVAIGQKYHAAGIKRFIGSPFFMRVKRFATGMHTWQVEEAEIAATANRLAITEPANPSVNTDAEKRAVAVLHRTAPGTVGYGFGNWAPHFAAQSGSNVREYQIWKQDLRAEPIIMDLSDRIIKNLEFNEFQPEIFAGFVHSELADCSRIHVLNMPEIGRIAQIIREMAPASELIIEIRTPLLMDNEEKRADMTEAFRHASHVHIASQPVFETWLSADCDASEFKHKTSEIPVCVARELFDPTADFSQATHSRLPRFNSEQSQKILYNGSINARRKLNEFLEIALPLIESGKMELTLCCNRKQFDKTYPKFKNTNGLHFVGLVDARHMAQIITIHDAVLSWIPPKTTYDSAWSTKAIEAALMEKPVLASQTLGHRLMEERGFDFIWIGNSQRSLRSALSNLQKTDQQKLIQVADRAKQYTWENQIKTFLGLN